MSGSGESTDFSMFESDLGDILIQMEVAAKQVKAREEKKATGKRSGAKTVGAPKKGRSEGTDTDFTKNLVYKIVDKTTKTLYLCIGLGTTEAKVKELKEAEHKLVRYMSTRGGELLQVGKEYQCVLDQRGVRGGYRFGWRPTEDVISMEIVGGDGKFSLFTTAPYPYHPYGLWFTLDEITPENENYEHTEKVTLGRTWEEELSYLHSLKKAGKQVVTHWTSPYEVVRSLAEVGGMWPEPDAIKRAVGELNKHITCWPPTAEDVVRAASAGEAA